MKHAHTLSITSTVYSANTTLDVIDKPFRFAIAQISGFSVPSESGALLRRRGEKSALN